MQDRSKLIIYSLIVSALALTFFHLTLNTPAQASETVVGRKYSVAAVHAVQGGDTIYVMDNDKEMVAMFTWDVTQKRYNMSDVKPMHSLFGGR